MGKNIARRVKLEGETRQETLKKKSVIYINDS